MLLAIRCANASVTFTAPTSGASVSFAGSTTVTTDASGSRRRRRQLRTRTAGTFQVTATAPGATQPATFNLTNVAASANKLGYKQQPTNTAAGQPIAPPVTVQLLDSFGNPVAMAGVSVSLQASPIATRFRTLRGTASVNTDANGLATFPNIIIDQAGAYTLEAQANGIASATSNQFNITAGAASSIQASGGTPQTTTILTAFPTPLQVTVADAQGNPVNGVTVSFTAPGSGASATLSAPSATTDAGGHASITATANVSAGSYTVTAAAAGAGSANFSPDQYRGRCGCDCVRPTTAEYGGRDRPRARIGKADRQPRQSDRRNQADGELRRVPRAFSAAQPS